MNSRFLIILLVIFLVLAAIVALQDSTPEPPASTPETTEETPEAFPTGTLLRLFPDMAVLDIQAIQIEDRATGERFVMSRDADGTWISPTTEQPLDPDTVSSIARTIVLLPYEQAVNITSQTDFTRYGFDAENNMVVGVIMADGQQHGIIFGDVTANEMSYYTLVDERDQIFRILRGPVDFLRQFLTTDDIES